jgi:polysaccharide biosynthesis/export protein
MQNYTLSKPFDTMSKLKTNRASLVTCLIMLAFSGIVGCSSLPASGPSSSDISTQAGTNETARYELIELDSVALTGLSRWPQESFHGRFGDYRAPQTPRIGVGDSLSVTIWEAGSGGLFTAPGGDRLSTGSKSVSIPEQVVGPDGQISIPYAGRIKVAGRTTLEVQNLIVSKLAGKAIEPQALVTIPRPLSTSVTVTGEASTGGRIPLSVKGDKILDVIASAGGIRSPVHETFVRLTRGAKTVIVALQKIISNPSENINMRAGDILTLVREPQTFTAFGATGRNAQINFDAVGITLEEALAKSGGLLDYRADASGIFIFRFEPASLVRSLHPSSQLARGSSLVPVIYKLNLREAESFFLAKQFAIRSHDVVYVSNSPASEVEKFFGLVNTLTGPGLTALSARSAIRN